MSGATIGSTLQRQLDAINQRDATAFASGYADDAEVFDPAYPEPIRGRDGIAKDIAEFLTAFPDLQARVGRVIENGDVTAYEMTFRATHQGALLAPTGHIPATGRQIEVVGAVFVRVGADGLIADERRYYDLAGLLHQLGQFQ